MDKIERALRSAVQCCDPHYCGQAADLLGIEHPDCLVCGGDECEECAERVADAMAAHLMPEGVRWPRFADGERAAFRDEIDVDGSIERIQGFKFYESGPSFVSIVGVDREKWVRVEEGERVKRPEQPAPELSDAVRCADCAHARVTPRGLSCAVHGGAGWFATEADGFCHRGEKR